MRDQTVGCDRCWPSEAANAWTARARLTRLSRPVDESHHIVSILGCPECGQQFVSVFTETIDWAGGEDPQRWTMMPVTPDEVAALPSPDSGALSDYLAHLPSRRSLVVDHPEAGPHRVAWSHGVVTPHHD